MSSLAHELVRNNTLSYSNTQYKYTTYINNNYYFTVVYIAFLQYNVFEGSFRILIIYMNYLVVLPIEKFNVII